MSTLSEIRIKARNNYIKIDPNSKVWSDDVLNSYLNRAYTQLQKDGGNKRPAQQTSTTISTVNNTREYSLPSDFLVMDMVVYNTQSLNKIERQDTMVMNSNNSIPNSYYLFGGKIGLYPTPDSTYTINIQYNKKLATLTSAQDSELPEDFDDAICSYAGYLAFNSVEKRDKADRMLLDYTQQLNTLVNSYLYNDSSYTFDQQRNKDTDLYRNNNI